MKQSKRFSIGIIFLMLLVCTTCTKDEVLLTPDGETSALKAAPVENAPISVAAIDALILKIENYVTGGDLEPGIANSLISKLENAKKSLEKGNEKAAMNQVQAVLSQLESLVDNGIIDPEVGEEIIYDTEIIAGENPTFIDERDGNEYKTILIGEQVWMAENLAFDAGDGCWAYNNDESNVAIYGRLYDWATVMNGDASSNTNPSGVQGICPDGWHVPSDDEWIELENYLIANGYNYDGTTTENKIAKSLAATTNWEEFPDAGTPGNDLLTNNSCGFSGLPGGAYGKPIYGTGSFVRIGTSGFWWSSTLVYPGAAHVRWQNYDRTDLIRAYSSMGMGLSVRCIKDE